MAYKTLALGTLATTSTTSVYTVPSNATTAVYGCVLTNATSNNITVDVLLNDGFTDYILKKVVIPGGSGKCISVPELSGSLSGSHIIKLRPGSSDIFNYFITGDQV